MSTNRNEVWGKLRTRMMSCLPAILFCLLLPFGPFAWATPAGPDGATAAPAAVLFLDSAVPDRPQLLSGLDGHVDVIELRPDQDGIRQIADALARYRDLASIQIMSHGAPGRLLLGTTALDGAGLDGHRADLQAWGRALKAGGGILLYGCDVAQGEAGDRFVDRLAGITGAPVAASTDATGSAALGGNWVLEKRTAPMSLASALSARAVAGYAHLLPLPANGLKDITAAMANGTSTVVNFPFAFNFVNNSGVGYVGDSTPGADGIYTPDLNGTSVQQTQVFTVNADGTNLATFDLTALSFTNYIDGSCPGITWPFDFTVTGYKAGGGTVTTTFSADRTGGFTAGNYGSFTAITGFQVSFTGPYKPLDCLGAGYGPPGNITFDSFTIANAANGPTVAGISPTGGPTAGGTSVTITGTNFTGATSVTIGGTAATGVTVVSATSITATTPAGSAGAANVAVTNPGGTGTGAGLFTYVPSPSVASVSPSAGPLAGGTGITITGTNFTGATGVTIGGAATTPAHAVGAVNVAVTTPGGTGTGTGLFTYATLPGAPSGVTATAGNGQATITFTAPASNGGSAITSYTATANPGGQTGTCAGPAACSITVTGLTNGQAYTFTVTANNAIGTGASSTASNSVTPQATAVTTGIPTLSPPGLIFLTGLLALLTLFAARRQR